MTLLEPARPQAGVRARSAPRRGATSSVLLLPPWTRAPWLSFRQPAVIFAVLGAAAILACASSSAALFLSSAASESLRVQLAAECPDAAYPTVQQISFGRAGPALDPRVSTAMTDQGLASPGRVLVSSSTIGISAGGDTTLSRLFYRDGATDQVRVLSSVPGEGVLIPEFAAQRLQIGAGDSIVANTLDIPVVGVYRDLFREPTVSPYWCSYNSLFLNLASVDPPPPHLVIATSPAVIDDWADLGGEEIDSEFVSIARSWIAPIDIDGLTLSEAREINGQRDRAFAEAGVQNRLDRGGDTGLLPEMTERTELIISGLRGPVIPIALGGSILALLLVGAAGSYWADRRVREVRLLSSRGVGPAALAGKAALELAIPAIVGTALGWLLARWLIRSLGPSPDVDPDAPWQAAQTAGVGLLFGMALLATVAGLRARGATERPIGAKRSWVALVPWELLLLAAALASWLQLRREDGVVLENNVAQVNLLLVSFPLLFLAGAAILIVRALAALGPLLRRRAGRWTPALYLATSRVTAARLVSAGLLAAVSMPIGVLIYGSALTGTSEFTLDAKARTLVGAEIALISVDRPTATPEIDALGTIVARYPYGVVADQDVTVLAIDPDTFTRHAYWDDRFGDTPLAEMVAALGGSDGVNAIAMGMADEAPIVRLGMRDVQLTVIGTADTLPGRRQPAPLFIVDAAALGEIDRTAGRFTEIWSNASEAEVRAALPEETRVFRVQSTDTVFRVANYLSVSWTFGYLQALAAFVGAVALGGLLLYLETRQRSRVASYAMARRMGLSPRSHLRSLLAELGTLLGLAFLLGGALAWMAVLTVYEGLEIDPSRPPGPLLTVPTSTVFAAAAATLLVAAGAAAYAQRAANRADMAEVLRLGS